MNKNYVTFGITIIRTHIVYFLLLICFLASSSFYGHSINKALVPAASPLVVPAGILSLTANCWGAGGGGSFITGIVSVTPVTANAQINYTIGQGGTGGLLSLMNGVDGGNTTFSTVTANAANVALVGLFSGGAGSTSAGSAGVVGGVVGGSGGSVDGGKGGDGKILLGPGGDGSDFGGGGGGGLILAILGNGAGGKGGNGKITVNYTCPTYSITNNISAGAACVSLGTSTITLSSSAAGLPIGTYTVVYDRSLPAGTNLEAPMVVSTAGSGTFTADGLTTAGSSTITIKSLKSVDCVSTISTNNTANVSVSVFPSIPILGTATQPNCAASAGSIVLSGLPVSGTVHQAGTTVNNYIITNSTGTMTITGLSAGSYSFSVSSGLCISSSTGNVVITSPVIKTWDGFNWSPAGPPSLDDTVIFTGDANITAPLNACSCQINSGVTIVVGTALSNNNDAIVTIKRELDVQGTGTLTFENNASLVQLNDVVNSGKIIYKRTTSAVNDFDYVYWSSPVGGQKLGLMSPDSDKYWSFADGYWTAETAGSIMTAGKGFIVRVPQYTVHQKAEFIGVPNNGLITIAVQGTLKGNIIGNPYPSAIDANKFITDNKDLIWGALYFWTHNTSRKLNSTGTQYEYSSNDYAAYNLTGGIAVASAAKSTDTNGDGIGDGIIPSGKIAVGQSFFVASKDVGTFKFTNSMRISASGSNSQFFKQTNSKNTKIEKSRVWLNLFNDGGAFKQLLVGYVTGATNDFDNLYDAVTLNGNAYVDFYSINNSNNYTIQGRKLPFDEADEVALGYKSAIEGILQIGIENADGTLANQAIYLEDKANNTIHDLTKGVYSFTTAKGEFNERFVLRYNNSLGTDDFETKENGVIVSVKNSQIKISSFKQIMSSVKLYDLKGSLLYEKKELNKYEYVIDHLSSSDQLMIVIAQLENGKNVSEKIIFQN